MTDLLCLFTQEAHHGPYYDQQHLVLIIAAPDMGMAQGVAKGYADTVGCLLWGACKIIKGARISGDQRIAAVTGW
jgi:hypothetical protein